MLPRSIPSALGLLFSILRLAAAQTTTDCQPLNTTDCPANPAFGMDYNFNFNATPNTDAWEVTAGSVSYSNTTGAAFTINKQGDSPTIRSKFYYFFGRVEVILKCAPGTGIISSVMGLSDDLDEIDWEFLGGNGTHAEANYFGKGRQDYMNAIYYPVSGGTLDDYHNYTTLWTNTSLEYYIDGALVRTLLPAEANSTNNYPQTPMRLSIGIWAGGDPTLPEGTRSWAGGDTDYTKGPFSMYVKSVRITDYHTDATEYEYGDMSGTASSIKVTSGNSTVAQSITTNGGTASTSSDESISDSVSNKWNSLSPVAKTAVYASAGGAAAAMAAAALFYFLRQRKRGQREAALAEARENEERMELAKYKAAGIDPDGLVAQSEYDADELRREGVTQSNSYSIPNSPAGGAGGGNEKNAWVTAATVGVGAGAGAMAAGGNGARSPNGINTNVAPYTDGVVSPIHSMGSPVSPVQRFGSPGVGQANIRSFSSPNPNMRMGSPAGGYAPIGDVQRVDSPAAMGPQRSFTAGGMMGGAYGQTPQGQGQGPYGGNDGQYWGGNGGHR